MTYLDMEIPSRSTHLWRYTPWKRIHPSKVETIPVSESVHVDIQGDCKYEESIRKVKNSSEIYRYNHIYNKIISIVISLITF